MTEVQEAKNTGTLFGVGVGPGDPELLTVKAVRVIQEVDVIAVPCAKRDGRSYALEIVEDLVRPDQSVLKLHFPMVKDLAVRRRHRRQAAQSVAERLAEGRDVAFLTEGDPLLYSTFAYILWHVPAWTTIEIMPGISSINAAAAQAHLPLVQADQRLAILPATTENLERLPAVVDLFDTVVLLKLHRTFEQVLRALDALHLTEKAVLVERASHALGRVERDIGALRRDEMHYMSLLVVSTGDGECDEA